MKNAKIEEDEVYTATSSDEDEDEEPPAFVPRPEHTKSVSNSLD